MNAYYAVNREYIGFGTLSPGFRTAVQKIWGRFIIYDDPTLPSDVVTSIVTLGNGTQTGDNISAAGAGVWPQWKTDGYDAYQMLKLNMTGGQPTEIAWTTGDGLSFNITESTGSGLEADLAIVDAYDWEGGRGARCDFWADIGSEVPE